MSQKKGSSITSLGKGLKIIDFWQSCLSSASSYSFSSPSASSRLRTSNFDRTAKDKIQQKGGQRKKKMTAFPLAQGRKYSSFLYIFGSPAPLLPPPALPPPPPPRVDFEPSILTEQQQTKFHKKGVQHHVPGERIEND